MSNKPSVLIDTFKVEKDGKEHTHMLYARENFISIGSISFFVRKPINLGNVLHFELNDLLFLLTDEQYSRIENICFPKQIEFKY